MVDMEKQRHRGGNPDGPDENELKAVGYAGFSGVAGKFEANRFVACRVHGFRGSFERHSGPGRWSGERRARKIGESKAGQTCAILASLVTIDRSTRVTSRDGDRSCSTVGRLQLLGADFEGAPTRRAERET